MNQQLQKLTNSIYILPHYSETDRPTLGIISGTNSSLIVDAGNSYAHAKLFSEQLTTLNLPDANAVIITHPHWDHWFGNSFYNIPIIANGYTKTEIEKQAKLEWNNDALDKRVKIGDEIKFCVIHIKKEFPDPNRVIEMKIPNQIIDGKTEIDLGNITCILESVDSDHCDQNILAFIPERKVLFIGDALYMNLESDEWFYTTKTLFPFLDKLESYNADIIVGSHSNPMKKLEYTKYFSELRIIGKTVEKIGKDYKKNVEALSVNNFILNEETSELIKAFISGL